MDIGTGYKASWQNWFLRIVDCCCFSLSAHVMFYSFALSPFPLLHSSALSLPPPIPYLPSSTAVIHSLPLPLHPFPSILPSTSLHPSLFFPCSSLYPLPSLFIDPFCFRFYLRTLSRKATVRLARKEATTSQTASLTGSPTAQLLALTP